MRRTQHILLASVLGSLVTADALAQSGPLDARAVRPAVMLLVDTSGSMERLPATSATDDSPLPTCSGTPVQKNRWAMTVEALTGSFQNYTCQVVDRTTTPTFTPASYDYGYYLPHIDFGTNPPQNTDGMLDSFANRIKFGLMTFDGVGTTMSGETLVPYLDFFNNTAFMTQVSGAQGMYSYGRVGRLSFPGCPSDYGVNAGARGLGTEPGSLISVGASENVDDILAINSTIQSSLLRVRPFGGTPIPAMLDDLEYYINNHTDIRASSDVFYDCRVRTAILITDGAPDALFRDSRFQCDQAVGAAAHGTCATNSGADAGADAATPTRQCECPYETADVIARRMLDRGLLDKLIVVAYNVQEPAALATLQRIAEAGWPPSDTQLLGSDPYPHLVRANGPIELRDQLDDVLRSEQAGVTSRSVPLAVNTGNATSGANSKRFDITAGFQLGEDEDQPWSGFLYRRRVTCEGTGGTTVTSQDINTAQGDSFHDALNSRSTTTRDLFTVTPQVLTDVNGTLRNAAYRPVPVYPGEDGSYDLGRLPPFPAFDPRNNLRPDGTPFSGTVATDTSMSVGTGSQSMISDNITPRVSFTNAINALYFGGSMTDPGRTTIVNYVRGDSRPGRIMADIYHSNPVALLPLNSASTSRFADINASYSEWLRRIIAPGTGAHYGSDGRPGVVFVGTNDGVLHAFNLDTWQDASGVPVQGAHELWGFIPPALFGKMAAMAAPAHQYMFDGTPEVKDVVLQKRPGTRPLFRTVLVSALRGAPAFIALDVTYPESPVFLWQVSFPDVGAGPAGETVGNPALTQVEVDWLGEKQQRAVAILPGGRGVASASCPTGGRTLDDGVTRARFPTGNNRNVRCWQRRGRALYVVDVATGQLLQEFGPQHFPSPLTGSVVVDSAGTGTASAGYFFDHDGVLWRLSMIGSDPSRWRVAPIYDMFANTTLASVTPAPQSWQVGRPPQYPPTLARDRIGNLVILAGSGEVDNPIDTAVQRVISLTEKRAPLATSDPQIGGEIVLNWQQELATNEGVTGPLTVFENNVYFATFRSQTSGGSQCSLGEARLYGAHAYERADPTVTPGAPKPALMPENPSPGDVPQLSRLLNGSNLVIGLTVSQQPICRNTLGLINSITQQTESGGASGGGLYQLRAMMSGGSQSGENVGGSAVRELPAQNLRATHPSSVSSWAASVE
jgi:type IV pilus assembly protein PilY1